MAYCIITLSKRSTQQLTQGSTRQCLRDFFFLPHSDVFVEGFPTKRCLRNERRNSILVTCHDPGLRPGAKGLPDGNKLLAITLA